MPNWNDVVAAVRHGVGHHGRRQDRGEVRHRQVRPLLHHRLRRDLRSELLRHRDPHLERRQRATTSREAARAGLPDARTSTSACKASRQPARRHRPRPYQIETNVSLQREVLPGTSVTLSYFRRDYKNLIWTDNLAVDPSDYTPFDVPSPLGNGEHGDASTTSTRPSSALVENLDQNSSRQLPGVHRLRRHVPEPLQGAQRVRRREPRQAGRRTPARSRIRTSCATATSPRRRRRTRPRSSCRATTRCRGRSTSAARSRATRATPAMPPCDGTILAEDPRCA